MADDPQDTNTNAQPKKQNSKTKTAIVTLAIVILLLLLLFAIRARQENEPPQPFDNVAPKVSYIKAVLDPPYTRFTVLASDVDNDPLTYTWTLKSQQPDCTDFTFNGGTATWRHDGAGCSHDSPTAHPGTITVVVSDGKHQVTRTDDKGAEGVDPDPLYPPSS